MGLMATLVVAVGVEEGKEIQEVVEEEEVMKVKEEGVVEIQEAKVVNPPVVETQLHQ